MPVTRLQKEDILKKLTDSFQRSKLVVFATNLGLSVEDLKKLRSRLREKGVEFTVAKKTLLEKAGASAGVQGIDKNALEGPVGAAFSYEDQIGAAKVLAAFMKENEKFSLVAGVMDGKFITKSQVIELSRLPSREELLAKLLGSMMSPLSGFVSVGRSLLSGFVRALDGVAKKKEATPS